MSTDPLLLVLAVDRIDGTEVIVEFSDSTFATYTPRELAEMRPNRDKADPATPAE